MTELKKDVVKMDSAKESRAIELAKKVASIKDTIVGLTKKGPLYVNPSLITPGCVSRWVANTPGNVENMKKLGYTAVDRPLNYGDDIASKSSNLGSVVTHTGKDGVTLILMEQPQELFDEVERVKADINRNTMSQVVGAVQGIDPNFTYGGVKIGDK